jgi:hypothetical protein
LVSTEEVIQDWINRGILLAYGKTPTPGGTQIIVDLVSIPGRAVITALPPNPPYATRPDPPDYAPGVYRYPALSWAPGSWAKWTDGHKLYFSSVFSDVNERKPAAGPIILSNPQYIPTTPPSAPLESLTTYYWAVDEVNDTCSPNLWSGDVWQFTIVDKTIIDTFEFYTETGKNGYVGYDPPDPLLDNLRATWIDGRYAVAFPAPPEATSGSYVQLNTDRNDGTPPIGSDANIALSPTQSMKFYYDNDGTITWLYDLYRDGTPASQYNYTAKKYSEASAAVDDAARLNDQPPYADDQDSLNLEIGRNWKGYKLLKVPYYGDPCNTFVSTDKLYVGLKDSDGPIVTVSNPDPNILKQTGWHYWYIKMQDFNTPGMNLADVARIYIGIGNRTTPPVTGGGRGAVFFDDIQLIANSVCSPGDLALDGDFNGDCKVDINDLNRMTKVWLGSMPTLPKPVIDINTSIPNLPYGTLSTWKNNGSGNGGNGGSFKDFNSAIPGYRPTLQKVEGFDAVVFDGNDLLIADFNAPASITGSHAFTAIYKVWNLDIGVEEWVIMWAKRGLNVSYAGRYAGVGYGTAPIWGVAAHWDVPDMGFDGGVPAAHTWHTIAVTYPGGPNTVETVMVDGVINATEGPKTLNIFPDCNVTVGAAYDGNSTIIPGRSLTPVFYLSGAVASVKIYNVAIPLRDLAILMGTPIDIVVDKKINFLDLAKLANNWMKTALFPSP